MDGLFAEVYKYGSDYLCTTLKDVIQKIRYSEVVLLDWRNATIEYINQKLERMSVIIIAVSVC